MASHSNKSMGSISKDNVAAVLQDVLPPLELYERAKRVCDIGAAIAGLALFSPIFLITALAIKLESQGPIFIREIISGHDNRAIRFIKFRVATCTNGNGMSRHVTHVGQILGQTGIEELPQLINVLRGEMSILGRRNVCRWPTSALWCERQND